MRKQSMVNKTILQSNPKHSKKPSTQLIQPKKPVKNIHRAPSKSPSLQPFYRSNSHDHLNIGLSFNKQISKGRYENSIENVNTKQQTFITNQESSYRSTIQCQSQNTKRKSISKDNKNILSAQKSFFQSIESRTSKKSIPKLGKEKKLKQGNKNNQTNKKSKSRQKSKDPKQRKRKTNTSNKKEKQEGNSLKLINQNIKKQFQLKRLKLQKRITQVSEEQFQCTMGSPKIIHNNFFSKEPNYQYHQNQLVSNDPHNQLKKTKKPINPTQQLLLKVKQQVESMLFKSHYEQSKLLVAIIFIQRLWRQKYVKKMINNYLKPKEQTPRVKSIIQKPLSNTSYQLKLPKNNNNNLNANNNSQKKIQLAKTILKGNNDDKMVKYLDKYKSQQPKLHMIKKIKSLTYQCFLPKSLLVSKIDKDINTVRIERIKEAKSKLLTNGRKDIKFCFQSKQEQTVNEIINKEIQLKSKQNQIKQAISLCSDILTQILNNVFLHNLSKPKPQEPKEKKVSLPTIKVSTQSIQTYLSQLISYLLSSPHQQSIISNLNKPLGIKPISFLKFLRSNNDDSEQQQDEPEFQMQDDEFCNEPVIPSEIFVQYQEYLEQKYLNSDQTYKNFKKNIQRIYNKAIIDSFSEILEEKRVYGLKGKPFPWQKSSCLGLSLEKINQQKLRGKMEECQMEVLRYSSYKFGNRYGIDEMKFLGLLHEEYIKSEYEWKAYDEEILEVQLEVSSEIVERLVEEMWVEMGWK